MEAIGTLPSQSVKVRICVFVCRDEFIFSTGIYQDVSAKRKWVWEEFQPYPFDTYISFNIYVSFQSLVNFSLLIEYNSCVVFPVFALDKIHQLCSFPALSLLPEALFLTTRIVFKVISAQNVIFRCRPPSKRLEFLTQLKNTEGLTGSKIKKTHPLVTRLFCSIMLRVKGNYFK